jgi:hypothetical protein
MAKAAKQRRPNPAPAKQLRFSAPEGLVEKLRELDQRAGEDEEQRNLAEARQLIDHTLAAEVQTAPPPKKRKKSRRPVGRPPDYESAKILQIAETFVRECGLPQTLELLKEKVRDACEPARVIVPGRTRFGQILSPFFRRQKRLKKSATKSLIN